MFCIKCGQFLPDGSAFCNSCGTAQPTIPAQPMYQQPAQPQYQPPVQPPYQPPVQPQYQEPPYQQPVQPQYQQPYNYQAPIPALPMKWFHFLIYFGLFAGAILNLASGIGYLTGSVYEMQDVSAAAVYAVFDSLELIDVFFGVACVAAAVLGIVTRFSLAKYKAIGPKLLISLYITIGVIGLIYQVAVMSILEDAGVDSTANFASAFLNIAMAGANATYFKKRAHLFVN